MQKAALLAACRKHSLFVMLPYPAAFKRAGFAARRLGRVARAQGIAGCSFFASLRTVFIQRRVFICLFLFADNCFCVPLLGLTLS